MRISDWSSDVCSSDLRISDSEQAHLFVGLTISSPLEPEKIANAFRKKGFSTLDLTTNEMAKTHLRYMVGGRSGLARHEQLFRFEFPERPGALMKFLSAMNPEWNISLFRSEEHTSELQSLMRISYAVCCWKKQIKHERYL